MGKKSKTLVQWHPVFYAGLQVEFGGEVQGLVFENEHHLGTKPRQIDVLITKMDPAIQLCKNIGHIFRTYNIVEYKSPEDYFSIDDFFKVIGYACLFKADVRRVDSIRAQEITISLVCRRKPRKLMNYLRQDKMWQIEWQEAGIYYIMGGMFPMQLIVTSELSEEQNLWLRNLTDDIQDRESIQRLVEEYHRHEDDGLYQSLMESIFRANMDRFKEADMCKALEEFIDEVYGEKWERRGIEKGMEKGRIMTLVALVKEEILTVKQAAMRVQLSEEDFLEKMKML